MLGLLLSIDQSGCRASRTNEIENILSIFVFQLRFTSSTITVDFVCSETDDSVPRLTSFRGEENVFKHGWMIRCFHSYGKNDWINIEM